MEQIRGLKKLRIIIDENSKEIYKMSFIFEGSENEKEITIKKNFEKALSDFARQRNVSVQQLFDNSFEDIEIVRLNSLITNVEVYVDEWNVGNNQLVEKIVATTSDGKTITYNKCEEIRDFLMQYCKQELVVSSDYTALYRTLNMSTRINFLENISGKLKVNVVKPIYKKIEILECSNDKYMVPTKIKVVTANHGEQVYDLLTKEKISDTNSNINDIYLPLVKPLLEKPVLKDLEKTNILDTDTEEVKMFKNITRRNMIDTYNMELNQYQSELEMMKINEEQHRTFSELNYSDYSSNKQNQIHYDRFIEYFAKQILEENGITNKSHNNYFGIVEKQKKILENDPQRIISSDFLKRIEVLEYQSSESEQKKITKLRVVTINNSFEISGYLDCLVCINRFAELKNINMNDLLQNSNLVVDLSNVSLENNQVKGSKKSKINLTSVNEQNFFQKLKISLGGLVGSMTNGNNKKR